MRTNNLRDLLHSLRSEEEGRRRIAALTLGDILVKGDITDRERNVARDNVCEALGLVTNRRMYDSGRGDGRLLFRDKIVASLVALAANRSDGPAREAALTLARYGWNLENDTTVSGDRGMQSIFYPLSVPIYEHCLLNNTDAEIRDGILRSIEWSRDPMVIGLWGHHPRIVNALVACLSDEEQDCRATASRCLALVSPEFLRDQSSDIMDQIPELRSGQQTEELVRELEAILKRAERAAKH